jgi:YVTN family beta-propeller protein
VANELDGTVSRIDPATNEVVATIQVGSPGPEGLPAPPSIAVLGDEIWVLVNTDAMLVRIDPATNEVNASVALPDDILSERKNRYRGLAAGAGALWVTDDQVVQVIRVDPVSLTIVATIPDINGYGLLATDDAVWVAEYLDTATVHRIDPATNTVVASIETASGPIKLAAGSDSIWVTNLQAASVTRIDPTTNTVIDTISLQRVNPDAPFPTIRDLTVDEHGVWVGNVNGSGLFLIDPATNEVVGVMQTAAVSAVAALDGSIWIADWEGGAVTRIAPTE